jgi:hypothetical protein
MCSLTAHGSLLVAHGSSPTLRFDTLDQQIEQADVAQLVEQPIRNRQVIGSSPIVGSSLPGMHISSYWPDPLYCK